MTSKMQFYQREEGTELFAANPVKLPFLSVVSNKVRQGRETWQNTEAQMLILTCYISLFHPSSCSNTAQSKFPLMDPSHSLVLSSLGFSAAIIKLGRVGDTVKMYLPEENGSDASIFTTYPVVTSNSLVGIQGAQIQLERGRGKKIQFFVVLKCKEFWGNRDSSEIFASLQACHRPLYKLQNKPHQNDSVLFAAAARN